MKYISKILLSLVLVNIIASSSVIANDLTSSYSFNKLVPKLCELTKNNQTFKFRLILRKAKTHIRSIYAYVSCDGESLLTVAKFSQSKRMIDYLNLKVNSNRAEKHFRLAQTTENDIH